MRLSREARHPLKYSGHLVGMLRVDQVKKLVIFLPPTLGDSVHHTATLRWLKDSFPGARLIAVTGALGTALTRHCGIADEVWEREWGQHVIFWKLLTRRPQLAIFSYVQNKQLRLAKWAGVRWLVGMRGGKHDSWLDLSCDFWEGRHHFTGGVKCLLEKMGIEVGPLVYSIPSDRASVARIDRDLPPGRYAAVMVGASHDNKEWPIERFREVMTWLRSQGFQIVSVGGPREAGRLEQEVDFDFANKLAPPETAELLRRCSILISNDTGVMHMAGAVGCPVVGIFGPGLPFEFRPPGEHVTTLGGECDCPIRTPETCRRDCLMRVGVNDVIAAAESLLDAAGRHQSS